jgi:putative zinc finger protein
MANLMADELRLEETAGPIPEDCLAVARHLWDLLDAQLSDAQAERLRRHIGECEICHRYHLYQKIFLDTLGAYRSQFGAPSRVKARVLESLREAGFVETR